MRGARSEEDSAPKRRRRDPIPWRSPKRKIDPFPWRSSSKFGRKAFSESFKGERIDPFSFRTKEGGTDITRFIGGGRRSRRYLAKEQLEEEQYAAPEGYGEEQYAAPEGFDEQQFAAPDQFEMGAPAQQSPPREKRDPYTMSHVNSDISRFISGNANINRFAGGSSGGGGGRSRGDEARTKFVSSDGKWRPGEGARKAARSLLGF